MMFNSHAKRELNRSVLTRLPDRHQNDPHTYPYDSG